MSANLPESLFPVDSEVTITITGRVVQADPRSGGVVVEFLNARGFPDRAIGWVGAEGVTVVAGEPATPEQVERRRTSYRTMAKAFHYPDEKLKALRGMPYGGPTAEDLAMVFDNELARKGALRGMSVRTLSLLLGAGYATVAEVQQASDDDLLDIRNSGTRALDEVREKFGIPAAAKA